MKTIQISPSATAATERGSLELVTEGKHSQKSDGDDADRAKEDEADANVSGPGSRREHLHLCRGGDLNPDSLAGNGF